MKWGYAPANWRTMEISQRGAKQYPLKSRAGPGNFSALGQEKEGVKTGGVIYGHILQYSPVAGVEREADCCSLRVNKPLELADR